MAVYRITNTEDYIGASTDSKPTSVVIGSTFYEYDTYRTYKTYDGTNWVNKCRLLSLIESSIGKHGGAYIDDTDAHTPTANYTFFAIQALEDIVINAVTGNIDVGGATIPEGNMIYGAWSSITLTSGSCIAYQKES